MDSVLVLGAGRIGKLIAKLLSQAKYRVVLADTELNITNTSAVEKFFKKNKSLSTLISCLPYYHTLTAAKIAKKYGLHYFDLTEDVGVSKAIKIIAKNSKTAFVPRCGLAPGLVGIIAHDLIQQFSQVSTVALRVGGLPQHANNPLHYAITWSVDGLINEYGNPCYAIENGKIVETKPLEDCEEFDIDGMLFEAFNTSGGLGNLIDLYHHKVNQLNYKTIRYPGHCEKMKFLMNDLKLNNNREILKTILETALPTTDKDKVILEVAVTGKINNQWQEKRVTKKYLPKKIGNKTYSALQITTAASMCAVVDEVLKNPNKYKGFIFQETIDLNKLKEGPFGKFI